MAKNYITREGGATVTVFVPYDCKNNCPFCINKQEYKDKTGFSVEKICKSIRKLHRVTPKCDFVFTGCSARAYSACAGSLSGTT